MRAETRVCPAVLVVEDEPLIRMEAIDMMEEAGFRVFDAGSADEAVALMERHEEIGILFTDVDMPGAMNGLGLAAHVRDHWPQVFIVIASGVINIDTTALPEGCSVYPKPYPTNQILAELKRVACVGE
ncbi:response regulator [Limimaricola sp. AA108-03]|uniref:response regulator n=1 Tax=Limimaricola sp. AA108-03 TaxID=3425945 RepID=UPI003D78025A